MRSDVNREINRALMRAELYAVGAFLTVLAGGALLVRLIESQTEVRRLVRSELIALGAARHLAEDDAARLRSQLRHASQVVGDQEELIADLSDTLTKLGQEAEASEAALEPEASEETGA